MNPELTVIGNDEAAFEIVRQAVKANRTVAFVLDEQHPSDWITTRALLSLITEEKSGCDKARPVGADASLHQLSQIVQDQVAIELKNLCNELNCASLEIYRGSARFQPGVTVCVALPALRSNLVVQSSHVVIATGIDRRSDRSASKLNSCSGPASRHVRVIGGDDYGACLAAFLQQQGLETQLVSRLTSVSAALDIAISCGVLVAGHPQDLPKCDGRVLDLRTFRGLTGHLSLNCISVEPDEHQQLWCGHNYETWCRGVYGIGNVIGFAPGETESVRIQAGTVLNHLAQLTETDLPDSFCYQSDEAPAA